MNIDKYKNQHSEIMQCIAELRKFAKGGISRNASDIARTIVMMSSTIKLHLAVEDQALYPALQSGNNLTLANMGRKFQDEMGAIASAYVGFAGRWNSAAKLIQDPEGFRSDANHVLKILHERIQAENTVFYPAIEAHH